MKNKLNPDLIGDLQSSNLNKETIKDYNFVDLNFKGYDSKSIGSLNFVLKNKIDENDNSESANINRALFWLSSKPGDYVREDKGGVLYNFLGKRSSQEDLDNFTTILRDKFNEQFSGDLISYDVKMKMDPFDRALHITMVIYDVLTGKVQYIEAKTQDD